MINREAAEKYVMMISSWLEPSLASVVSNARRRQVSVGSIQREIQKRLSGDIDHMLVAVLGSEPLYRFKCTRGIKRRGNVPHTEYCYVCVWKGRP